MKRKTSRRGGRTPKPPEARLTAYRWTIGFDETDGPRVLAAAGRVPVAIWVRELVLERLEKLAAPAGRTGR